MALKSVRIVVFAGALLAAASWSTGVLSDDVTGMAGVGSADSQFFAKAAAGGIAEIQLGELALEKSSDDNVKKLARRVVDDHRQADTRLAALGQRKHLDFPSRPDADAVEAQARLARTSGRAFDQAWTKLMVSDHQKAVKLFNAESRKGKDADLRKFAADALPVLRDHLKSAQGIAAVSTARDRAMDDTMKTMSAGNLGPPPASSATAPVPPAAPATSGMPAPAASTPARAVAPSGEKHGLRPWTAT